MTDRTPKSSLSILIPTYNHACPDLAGALARQCAGAGLTDWELLVAEDGSTDSRTVDANRAIGLMPHCRHIIREHNAGRAAIRNLLARAATKDWLLFADSDMVVRDPQYITAYLRAMARAETEAGGEGTVIYGGYEVRGDARALRHNLRYAVERSHQANASARLRSIQPYRDFHTSNFAVPRRLFLAHPLDEHYRRYGYEDVVWGLTLSRCGITVTHADIRLSFERFEPNASYLRKTDEAMETLAEHAADLAEVNRLPALVSRLARLGLTRPMAWTARKVLRPLLEGNNASLFLFYMYKAGRLAEALSRHRLPHTPQL